ncbi:MAG: HD-GYP domain-containing protein [Thermoguttaceae bacterium]|nr:HD-GYP domain-containing protein [Thermoguttaceae bacterium]MDW8038521.1 HD-GYP domain-containing protein [Thermoguttaceae bacterium]
MALTRCIWVQNDVQEGLLPGGLAEVLAILERAFGSPLAVVDADTGQLVRPIRYPPGGRWELWTALCGQVAQHGQAEFLEDEDPLLVLAFPLGHNESSHLVAVGIFLCRSIKLGENLAEAAAILGIPEAEVGLWASRQLVWSPEALIRLSDLAIQYVDLQQQAQQFAQEAESLSAHLANTYEEISLLHRLTRNLKISRSDEELGRVVLEWLLEVLLAEGVALQLLPVTDAQGSLSAGGRREPVLLTAGRCPVDNASFSQLIEYLNLGVPLQPVVINRTISRRPDWPMPQIRQMILVALVEGENLFGWLAGFNHVEDGEFGTVEASLLSSVAAILGIHSGNLELYRQQSELLAGIVRALTSALDARDKYTCGHSERVAQISVRLAQQLGCDSRQQQTIYLAGLLHDIGKIGVEDSVLRKPDRLSPEEYEHIKRHVQIGYRILQDLKKLDNVLPIILYHHEAWDGSGYPDQLPAEQIPLGARIVAVADAFDAMSSDRPYRKGMPMEKIENILRAGAGRQWDPKVIDAFFQAKKDILEIVRRERAELPAAWLPGSSPQAPVGISPGTH